jgi:cytoskeletal protein CcmA (bactofilin family)
MTSIGPSIVIAGEISADEDVMIDGCLQGHLLLRNAALTIGPKAQVTADIRASRITIQGTVRGNVTASERIELMPSASIEGDLSANHVVVADGAHFTGRIDMDRRTIAAKVAGYKAKQRG